MPRRQGNKIKHVLEPMLVSEDTGLETIVKHLSKKCLPRTPWLPPFDVAGEIDKFAAGHGMESKDVSRLFNKHKDNLDECGKAWNLVLDRSRKHPNTVHYILATPDNLEAVSAILEVLVTIAERGLSPDEPFAFGYDMIHGFVVRNGFKLRLGNLKESSVLAANLQCLAPDRECPICLDDLDTVTSTAVLFDCHHHVCSDCAARETLECCPVCRCTSHQKVRMAVPTAENARVLPVEAM
jgi:hypothetical protein